VHVLHQHFPQLVENGIVLKVESQPYLEVLEGSFIVVEGSCFDMDSVSQEKDNPKYQWIIAEIVLDTEPESLGRYRFPKIEAKHYVFPMTPEQEDDLEKDGPMERWLHSSDFRGMVCMLLSQSVSMGAIVGAILLESMNADRLCYRRRGYIKIGIHCHLGDNTIWQRRTLKLV
jgi:hypothetical protein